MKKMLSITITLLLVVLCMPLALADTTLPPSAVVLLFQSTFSSENGTEYEFKYDEESKIYSMYITQEGLAYSASMAKFGDDIMSVWVDMRDSIMELSDTAIGIISDLTGDTSPFLSINVRNDLDPDKILLSTLNSVVIYDVVADESTSSSKTAVADQSSASTGEKNALKSAKQYLEFTSFSYTGLVEQLEYEGYSSKEAKYGADYCGADWNEQAAKSARNYLEFTAFSYSGLVEQLEYEGYSSEEAKYGVDRCGADWNEQAAKSAKQYLEYSSFSRNGLIDQLEYEGFTNSQAEYGVSKNGY